MRWIVDPSIKAEAPHAIDWARAYLGQYDCSKVDWLRLGRGRVRPGERAPTGLYGRCWYPTKEHGYRISCQVPGPWPYRVITRVSPLYVEVTYHVGQGRPDVETERIFEIGSTPAMGHYWAVSDKPRPSPRSEARSRNGRFWWTQHGATMVNDLGEAIAWILGHEAFHFLRRSKQISGRNTEVEADAAANGVLETYRSRVS